jgi:hypothetical protein
MSFYWSCDESPEQDRVATPDEAVREWAYNCGGDACRIHCQWLLHDFDVWVRNPHYTGPERRHPEDFDYEDVTHQGEPQGARGIQEPDDCPF